jgi:hypothetical protein
MDDAAGHRGRPDDLHDGPVIHGEDGVDDRREPLFFLVGEIVRGV